jgi:hypothetical protein
MRCGSALIVSGGLTYGMLIQWPGAASADVSSSPNASQFCEANNDLGMSHGECVRSLESSEEFATRCKTVIPIPGTLYYVNAEGMLVGVPVNNRGECVSFFNEHGKF